MDLYLVFKIPDTKEEDDDDNDGQEKHYWIIEDFPSSFPAGKIIHCESGKDPIWKFDEKVSQVLKLITELKTLPPEEREQLFEKHEKYEIKDTLTRKIYFKMLEHYGLLNQ